MLNTLKKLNIQFVKMMPLALVLSAIFFICSIVISINKQTNGGFNLGIDFAGGVELKVNIAAQKETISIAEVRSLYNNFETTVNIQEISGENNVNSFLLRFKGGNELSTSALKILSEKYGEGNITLLGNTIISGIVSLNNMKLAIILIAVSWIAIMIYITIRFDIRYAFPAIITLIHNIVIVFGIIVLLNKEMTVLILSALLTLIGYTINDIIVVFDRIRENTSLERLKPFKDIVNTSLNQVLGRTIMTSLSTLIAAGAIMLWGGPILHNFAFTFFTGVIVGTYSSNFIASSLLIMFMKGKTDTKK